jgi:hypothetical protein
MTEAAKRDTGHDSRLRPTLGQHRRGRRILWAGVTLLTVGILLLLLGLAAGTRGWPIAAGSLLGRVSAENGGDVILARPGSCAIYYTNPSSSANVPAAQVVGPGYSMVPVTTKPTAKHQGDTATSHWVGDFAALAPGGYRVETDGFPVAHGSFEVRQLPDPNRSLVIPCAAIGILLAAAGTLFIIKYAYSSAKVVR